MPGTPANTSRNFTQTLQKGFVSSFGDWLLAFVSFASILRHKEIFFHAPHCKFSKLLSGLSGSCGVALQPTAAEGSVPQPPREPRRQIYNHASGDERPRVSRVLRACLLLMMNNLLREERESWGASFCRRSLQRSVTCEMPWFLETRLLQEQKMICQMQLSLCKRLDLLRS